jgi:hypothetical protein
VPTPPPTASPTPPPSATGTAQSSPPTSASVLSRTSSPMQHSPADIHHTAAAPTAPGGHHMQTRSRTGIFKPNPKYALTTEPSTSSSTISPLPKSVRTALKDPHWRAAMASEFDALQRNRTWRLVDRPPGANVVSGKWVFKHKLNPDGSLERYKLNPDGWCVVSLNAPESISAKHSHRW